MLNRRSFLGALAGLPVLGHIMQRAPLPSDPVQVVGYNQWLDYPPAQTGGVPLHTISTTTYPEWASYGVTTTMTDAPMRMYIANIQYHRAD